MNNTAKIVIAVLCGIVVGLGIGQFRSQISLGGTTNFNDLAVDSITNAGALTNTGAATLSGTLTAETSTINGALTAATTTINGELTLGNCASKAFLIPQLNAQGSTASTTLASTTVTVPGLAAGDMTIASWVAASATGTLSNLGYAMAWDVQSANTGVVSFFNAVNATATSGSVATGTIKFCYFD